MKKNASVEALFKRTTAGIKPGLDVVVAILKALDNPHQKLAVVHVAGTNGKGSVCAMLESILQASGFKTGMYTSPHLIDFAERFRISGKQISEERLNEYIERLEKTADEVEDATGLRGATFFEISTAIAFQYFADEGVDVAIIETGMGGRWDASNIVIPLVSVITHIDIDHTNFLGDTLEKIAAEKAGIIKAGRPVVSAPQKAECMTVLQQQGQPIIDASDTVTVSLIDRVGKSVCTAQKLKIETQSRSLPPIRLPLLGACQRENCAVAVATIEMLADILSFEPKYKKGLESVVWGARFQTIDTDPLIILDGAHNPSAGKALVKTLMEVFPTYQIGFILGFLDDKEAVEFLQAIKPLVRKAWTIPIHAPRGTSAEHAAAECQVAGFEAEAFGVSEAWEASREWASAEPNRLVVITGSLYLKQVIQYTSVISL